MTSANWDARFRAGDNISARPDPFLSVLSSYRPLLPDRPRAVDVACGAGRHALALARQGFRVDAVDQSTEALERVADRARAESLEIKTLRIDLETDDARLGEATYDLAVVVHYLHRPLFPLLDRALRPGGLLLYKTYTRDQLAFPGGPRNPAFLLEPNELLERFRRYRVLRYEEEVDGRGTAALLAHKPRIHADRPRTDQSHCR